MKYIGIIIDVLNNISTHLGIIEWYLTGTTHLFQLGIDPNKDMVFHVLDKGSSSVELGVADVAHVGQPGSSQKRNTCSKTGTIRVLQGVWRRCDTYTMYKQRQVKETTLE